MKMKSVIFFFLVVAVWFAIRPEVVFADPSPNLILNPGNEEPLVNGEIPFWTEVSGTGWWQNPNSPCPRSGSYCFASGIVATGELIQDIDVSAYAATIDAHQQPFQFEGYARSFLQSPPDSSRFLVEYRDATNTIALDAFDTSNIANTSAWQLVSDTRHAPIGTRIIRIHLITIRGAGEYNDGYFDDLSLVALDPIPAPVNLINNPGAELLIVNNKNPFWEDVLGTFRRGVFQAGNAPAHTGTYFFHPNQFANAEIKQDVDVSAWAGLIDAGDEIFTFTGYVRSFQQTPTDSSRIIIEYRDESNATVLASYDSGEIANYSQWVEVSDARNAPAGTRIIRIRLLAKRYNGTELNGYFDSLSLYPEHDLLEPLLVVNRTDDAGDADVNDSVCDSDLLTAGAQCTLRAAIEFANAQAGLDTIRFNLPLTGTLQIQPTSPLPAVSDPVIIDGATQPGATCPDPTIQLDGSLAGSSADGLMLSAGGSTVRGLQITRFSGNGITVNSDANTIACNAIGSDSQGTLGLGNSGYGIYVDWSRNNIIGGTSAADRNLIGGSGQYGIALVGNNSSDNHIEGNYIGFVAIDFFGSPIVAPNNGGILLNTAQGNTVGGTVPGAGNTISGNNGDGIFSTSIFAPGNFIQGNIIGLDAGGTLPVGNTLNGIHLTASAESLIGGSDPAAANVISANGENGIQIDHIYSTDNLIQGNHIGTDVNGVSDLGNTFSGVRIIEGASNNTIGGTAPGAGNLISGNHNEGVLISDYGGTPTGNLVQGNLIGTDVTGQYALGNGFDVSGTPFGFGIYLSGSSNTIGGSAPGAGNVISGNIGDGIYILGSNHVVQGNLIGTDAGGQNALGNLRNGVWLPNGNDILLGGLALEEGNVISANVEHGIWFDEIPAGNNIRVQGNTIGLNSQGTAALGNGESGVYVEDSSGITVGGTEPGAGNLISGNSTQITIITDFGPASTGNLIQGNTIGPDASGTVDLTSGGGIDIIDSPGNTIGGAEPGAGNLIAGSNFSGIFLGLTSTDGTIIQGNVIGLDSSGTTALPNAFGISLVGATNTLIGGTEFGAGNVISGNYQQGIYLNPGSDNNTIQGNIIGADAGGTMDLGNGFHGIVAEQVDNNTIGGSDPGAGNLISGNDGQGILLVGANNNAILGNFIGTDMVGIATLGNGSSGIFVNGSSNTTIGGPSAGEGNLIGGNGSNGVTVFTLVSSPAVNNTVRGNAIYENGGLALDLENDGVTANDANDLDTGANELQNFPLLKTALTSESATTIEGVLLSTAETGFTLDFYATTACDPSGFGEAETYLGSATVTTNANGRALTWTQFGEISPERVPAGAFITATATDANGNTSEFSSCLEVKPNYLFNAGFESGPGNSWDEISNSGQTLVTTDTPHAGSYSAELCGLNSCTAYVQQLVTIPADGRVSYFWYMVSQEVNTTALDILKVQIVSTDGQILKNLQSWSNTGRREMWQQETLKVGSFAGQTVWLRFVTFTNSTRPTVFYIDDVTLH